MRWYAFNGDQTNPVTQLTQNVTIVNERQSVDGRSSVHAFQFIWRDIQKFKDLLTHPRIILILLVHTP